VAAQAHTSSDNIKFKKKTPLAEIRHSSRIQQKIVTGKGANSPPPSSSSQGTLAIIDQFPFAQFSDSDVILLFEKTGFSLGSKEETRFMIVQKLRSLMTSRFNQVVSDISNKYSLVLANTNDRLIDISMEVPDTSDS
jgi:hypothetical protein